MKHLIVYSHPNPQSFNHAILETFSEALKAQGHDVRIRDLYAMSFDPVLKGSELEGFKTKTYPDDIKAEQEHVRWAEVITFICPVWWGGLTSNLRGYMDRVFSLNFAYAYTPSGVKALLAGKKILLINTMGDSAQTYEKEGFFDSMNQLLDKIAFQFCGLEVIGHKYFGSVVTCPPEERKAMLEEVRRLAEQIHDRKS